MDLGAQEELRNNFWCFKELRCSTFHIGGLFFQIPIFSVPVRSISTLAAPKPVKNWSILTIWASEHVSGHPRVIGALTVDNRNISEHKSDSQTGVHPCNKPCNKVCYKICYITQKACYIHYRDVFAVGNCLGGSLMPYAHDLGKISTFWGWHTV